MSSVVTPSNRDTWEYLEKKLPGLEMFKEGRTVIVKLDDFIRRLVPYPEIDSVSLERRAGLIVPVGVDGWVAQWKANGSNIRILSVDGLLLAFTRGGYLLDWRAYEALLESDIYERLIDASNNSRFLLFGELVGRDSLVRLCVREWDSYLKRNLDYIVFDVYDMELGRFLPLRDVEVFTERFGLRFSETEWSWDYEKLNNLIRSFLDICDGEMWEGFVFKKPERGTLSDVWKGTLKWRMDATVEFAEIIYEKRTRDRRAWRLYEALRKFVIEGYLDPPTTKSDVDEEAYRVREEIQKIIYEGRGDRSQVQRLERELKRKLQKLVQSIASEELLSERKFNRVVGEAIKTFVKVHLYAL